MKYLVQVEVDPELGVELEEEPRKIQEWIEAWRAFKPIGMYFSLARRSVTIVLEAPNEEAFFPALHATWVLTGDYPEVMPVVSVEEFPALLQRLGLAR